MRQYSFSDFDAIIFELKNQKAAIVPTDTTFGIVSLDSETIYRIKKRSHKKKLVIFIPDIDYIPNLSLHEKHVLKKYWPGQLTIIKDKIGYRIPDQHMLIKLLERTGPLFSSSANVSGNKPITNYDDAKKEFKNNWWDLIFVNGKINSNVPSTIIDLDRKKILREGIISGKAVINDFNSKSI